jgi:excisionase family DNA binding protein
VRAIGAALAPYAADDDVDLAALTVDSQQAASILRYHREHVRRLLRSEALEAEKEGNEYRIPLASVIAALEGGAASWVEPAVLRQLRALVPVWTSPQSESDAGP